LYPQAIKMQKRGGDIRIFQGKTKKLHIRKAQEINFSKIDISRFLKF